MRRSNRCRWISFLSPPVSFSSSFSEFNRIRNNFFLLLWSIFLSSFPSSEFFLLQTILSFFQNKICPLSSILASLLRIEKSTRRVEEERQVEERLPPKTAYFNVITISQLRPRHHRYQRDVRRRVKLTTAHVNEHRLNGLSSARCLVRGPLIVQA